MAVTRKTISVAWLEQNNACNIEVCRQYFRALAAEIGQPYTDETEFALTPEGILAASQRRVLSTNWLASRILTGPERAEFEREQKIALDLYEKRMAPILAAIVARATQPE